MVNARPPSDSPRRGRGFARAGGLVAPNLAAAAKRRGFDEARLVTHWSDIAGPDIASAARPVKMTRPRGGLGGTLTIEVEGARAPEIQMLLPTLAERVNAALGWRAVARIQLVQIRRTLAPGFAEARPSFDAPSRAAPAAAAAPVPAPLATALSSIGDDALRRALETLARNVLSKDPHAR